MDVSQQWVQTWINVLTRPGETAFQEELRRPYATLSTGLVWVVVAAVIAALLGWVNAIVFPGQAGVFDDLLPQAGFPPEMASMMQNMLAGGMTGGFALFSIVLTPLFFLIGVGIVHLIARMLGGTGDFGQYGFLAAAYSAPLTVIGAVIGLIPLLGGCIAPLLSIYGIVLNIFAVRVSHNLSMGRAIAAVLLPFVLLLIIMGCLVIAVVALLAPANWN
jgi:hypothetical protein